MDKSETLRLADWLEDQYDPTFNQEQAAAELRRLHASCEDYAQHKQRQDQRILALCAQRDALLAALKAMLENSADYTATRDQARAVIKAVEEDMTRDDIIRMAREAGVNLPNGPFPAAGSFALQELLHFAALVVAARDVEHQQTLDLQQRSYEREIQLEVEAEREACAALLDANGMRCGEESLSRLILETNASAIRARGNT